jgi:N-acetylglucosamine-6-sulfatase
MQRRSFLASLAAGAQTPARPRNVLFILTDDHRYDALGFLKGQAWLETPHLDKMARNGVHCKNAFVTTALCSPSRASILTGQYAHQHRIVDNNTAVPPGTRFFPELLQKAGYQTAFFGKWHMGNSDDAPQPGFHHWVSFRGQGTYNPSANGLNINGQRTQQQGYITDELTDHAVNWIKGQRQPWFAYLAHKAVHSEFQPAPRHKSKFAGQKFVEPASQRADIAGRPMWVQNQRNSFHGVEYPYHSRLSIAEYYQRYAETLCGVDDSVGRLLSVLESRGELDSTLVIYMGDNGFAFGEHGLIDKRTAYEESMRVPMIAHCPELSGRDKTLTQMVANIDIAPTVLEAAGVSQTESYAGRSMLPLLRGQSPAWRDALLYEYYWERNFPHTPTQHAVREDRFKYIRYHGIWDLDELYDLQADPLEMRNLISMPEHQATVRRMNQRLFAMLKETGGISMPLWPDSGGQQRLRSPGGSGGAAFPADFLKLPPPAKLQ